MTSTIQDWFSEQGWGILHLTKDDWEIMPDEYFTELRDLSNELTPLIEQMRGYVFDRECDRINNLSPEQRAIEYSNVPLYKDVSLANSIIETLSTDANKLIQLINYLKEGKK